MRKHIFVSNRIPPPNEFRLQPDERLNASNPHKPNPKSQVGAFCSNFEIKSSMLEPAACRGVKCRCSRDRSMKVNLNPKPSGGHRNEEGVRRETGNPNSGHQLRSPEFFQLPTVAVIMFAQLLRHSAAFPNPFLSSNHCHSYHPHS